MVEMASPAYAFVTPISQMCASLTCLFQEEAVNAPQEAAFSGTDQIVSASESSHLRENISGHTEIAPWQDDIDMPAGIDKQAIVPIITKFFEMISPPAAFSRRWFQSNFGTLPSDATTRRKIARLYQDSATFDLYVREWTSRFDSQTLQKIHDEIMRSGKTGTLKTSQYIAQREKTRLTEAITAIVRLADSSNDMAVRLANVQFDDWDLVTPENPDDFSNLIEDVLKAYGFTNAGEYLWQKQDLSYSHWAHPPPPSILRLVAVRFPEYRWQQEVTRKLLLIIRNEKEVGRRLQEKRQVLDVGSLPVLDAANRILEVFGYQDKPYIGETWRTENIPEIVLSLPSLLKNYENAFLAQNQRFEEQRTFALAREEALKVVRADLKTRSSLPVVLGNSTSQFRKVSGRGADLVATYSGMSDPARDIVIEELMSVRGRLSRWSWQRWVNGRLLVNLMNVEFSGRRLKGTEARAGAIGRAFPELAKSILDRLRRSTSDDPLFTLLGDSDHFRIIEARAAIQRAREDLEGLRDATNLLSPDGSHPKEIADFERRLPKTSA